MTTSAIGGRVLTQQTDAAAALRAAEEQARRAAEEARRLAEEARRKAEEARRQAEAARKAADEAAAKAQGSGSKADKDEAARLESSARTKELEAARLQARAVLKEKEQALAQSKLDDATRNGGAGPSQATRDAQAQVERAQASVDFYEKPTQPVLKKPIDSGEFSQVQAGEGIDQFARRNGMTRAEVLALNPQFDVATANNNPGTPPAAAGKRDLDGLEHDEWLRVAPDQLDPPAVKKPEAPVLPTAADVGSVRVDGMTLHESTMAALMKQYADAPEGSDQHRFSMLIRAQGAVENGVDLDDENYRKDMPVDVLTSGVIDKQKVTDGLKQLTNKPAFAQQFANDYQKELDQQFTIFFPKQTAPGLQRNALWAGLTHGEGHSYPAYGQGYGSQYPSLGGPLTVTPPGGLQFTQADHARGNRLLATTQVPGLPQLPGPVGTTQQPSLLQPPYAGDGAGKWLADVNRSLPGTKAVVDPITADLSHEVVQEIQRQAGQSAQPAGFNSLLLQAPDTVSVTQLDARLATDHPELTPRQRADVIEQGYEMLGISDRQAKQYAAAAAPYLEVRNVTLEGNDKYDLQLTQQPPGYATLRKGAPQSAVDAWRALQNTTAMRGSLDPQLTLGLPSQGQPSKPDPALDTLGSDDLKKAVDSTLDGKFTPQSIAQQYAGHMTSPAYGEWLKTLPAEDMTQQVQADLLNIQAFDAGIATKTADRIGNQIFDATYAGVRPSETDDDKGQAASYTAINVLRWTVRTTGLLAGSDADAWKAAGQLFRLVKSVDAKGGDAGDVKQVEQEIEKQQTSGQLSADDAKSSMQWVKDINRAGGWASYAGLLNAGVANDKFSDPAFRQKLKDGDVDAWMQTLNHLDIGLSYGEHYLRVVASAESRILKTSHFADAIHLYKGDFGDVLPQVKASFRPTMGELSDALKGVDLTDKAAVQKALTDNMNPQRKVFRGIKYDNAALADTIATQAGKAGLTPGDVSALKTSAEARLGFLSMTTGELADTSLGRSIAKQSGALVGVNLSDGKAVANALQAKGFSATDADFIGQRIADTNKGAKGATTAANRFEVYGKLLTNTYGQAPTVYPGGMAAAAKAGDAAVLGTLRQPAGAAHTASDAGRGLRLAGVPIKGAIALLDIASGPLSGYFAYKDISEGIKTDNGGYIAAGVVEGAGAVAFGLGGAAELGLLATGTASAGPFFIAGFVLTAAGLAIYELSRPSAIEQNTTSLQDYFRSLEAAGPGVLKPDWEGEVKEWSDANQTGSPIILAPGPLDGRSREPGTGSVA